MSREAKPYLERGWYVSRPSGQYLRLCPQEEGMKRAKEILREHLVRLAKEKSDSGGKVKTALTVTELFALFLEAVQVERSPHTYADYQRWLTEFAKEYGSTKARAITRGDANNFKRKLMTSTWTRGKSKVGIPYEPKTINHALIALRRAFNWAIENEYLTERNPFAKIKLLPKKYRQRLVTEEEYQAMLAACRDNAFRDILTTCRLTDARPSELRRLTWSMVDWENKFWLFTTHKTSSTSKKASPRVIGMHPKVEEILLRRRKEYPDSELVFLNSTGRPWSRNALILRMRRLREKLKINVDGNGEKLTMYCNRRTFGTEMASDPTIPEAVRTQALGHTNPQTTQDYYIRLKAKQAAEATRKVADKLANQSTNPGK